MIWTRAIIAYRLTNRLIKITIKISQKISFPKLFRNSKLLIFKHPEKRYKSKIYKLIRVPKRTKSPHSSHHRNSLGSWHSLNYLRSIPLNRLCGHLRFEQIHQSLGVIGGDIHRVHGTAVCSARITAREAAALSTRSTKAWLVALGTETVLQT